MKKYSTLEILLLFTTLGFSQQAPTEKVDGPILTLEKKQHDFCYIFKGYLDEQLFNFNKT
jgi:hypothetical protein